MFYHPAYSPDLDSRGYHLFLHLKRFLAKQHFLSDNHLHRHDCHRLSPAVDLFDTGVRKLVSWYDTCFNSGGSYGGRCSTLDKTLLSKHLVCPPPFKNSAVRLGTAFFVVLNTISDGMAEQEQKKCCFVLWKNMAPRLQLCP
ncbi:hypothetical protein AVEN_109138-1 [Araneus ventricosus]|uniref:Uncharacterized protein n=1 Tax=Araneus ventricosus TaxID=182803 RepID=A0A4Y2KGU9_ARAVE|nr:hypothetical protein AVEN_109138-1 [Araneus ventricosus]